MEVIRFGQVHNTSQNIEDTYTESQKQLNYEQFKDMTVEDILNNLSKFDASTQSNIFELPCAKDEGFKFIMSINLLARLVIRTLLPDLKGEIELKQVNANNFTEPLNALDTSLRLGTDATPKIIPDVTYIVNTKDTKNPIGKRKRTAVTINLEMQGSYGLKYNLKDRVMYYIARHMAASLKNTADYEYLNDVFSIWFVQSKLYPDDIPIRHIVMTEHYPIDDFGCCLYKALSDNSDIPRDNKPYEYIMHALIIELPKITSVVNKVLSENSTSVRIKKNFGKILFAYLLRNLSNNNYTLSELFKSIDEELNKYRTNTEEYMDLEQDDFKIIKGENIMDKINETYGHFESSYNKMAREKEEMAREIEHFESSYDKMAREKEEFESSYNKMAREIEEMAREIEEMARKKEEMAREKEYMTNKIMELKSQLVIQYFKDNMPIEQIAETVAMTQEQVNQILSTL